MSQSTILSYASPAPADGSDVAPQRLYLGLAASSWMKIGLVAFWMILLFWPNLRRLWWKTNPFTGDPNWGHALFIPIIGLYYLYINRDQLLSAPVKTGWSALPLVLGGILMYGYGIWPGQNDFVKDFGMVITLFGVVALLSGWSVMKVAWFPIAYLVCAIPWPGLVYTYIAFPLQQIAADGAVFALKVTGVDAYNSGTKIFTYAADGTPRKPLNVAEACAGLRSLMTFVSVGAAVAFLSTRPVWEKLTITLTAIPIAIFCNVVRVAGQGLLDHYVSDKLSESFAHTFVGMVMLIPAFFLIMGVGWLLDRMFIEQIDRRQLPAAAVNRTVAARGADLVVPIPRHSLVRKKARIG